MAEKKETEYRFMVVGKSGSGKSSTANTIMGENLFSETTGLASGTKTCEVRKSSKPQKGVTFRIVDTPGLFDPTKSTEEICEEIIKATAYLHPSIHAILYVLKPDRYTPEERETFNRLKGLFDHNVVKHIIIIFTRGDELKKKKISIDNLLLQADEPFQEVLQECGNRVLVFDNVKHNQKSTQKLLELVVKMCKENEAPYTCSLQNTVNVKLERRATMRTQERIEQESALKEMFTEMKEQVRKVSEEAENSRKYAVETRSQKERIETLIKETVATREKEEQKAKERERQEKEQQERVEEQKALEKKREQEATELERKEQKREQEFADLQKQLEKLKIEQEMSQKMQEEKRKMQEEYEMKLEKEKKKYESEELEKIKQDIAANKEKHWLQDIAGGLVKAFKSFIGQ